MRRHPGYGVRSQLVHGATFSKKKGFVRADEASLVFLGNAVRASLLYFIGFELSASGLARGDVLRSLDAAVFDETDVDEVRKAANEFWGFGRTSREYLYANRWEEIG